MHPAVPLYPPRNLTVIVGAHKTWRHPEFVKASVNQKENKIVREIVYDKTKVRTVREVIPHKKYLTDMPLYDIGILVSAPKSSIRRFVITEKAPTRAFS